MTDVVRTEQGAEFLGLPDTRSLGEALILSGPYKVDKAPNAYSFSRPNNVDIDWRAILAKAGIPAPPTNAGQLRTYVEDAWATNGAAPDDALIDGNAFDLEDAWPAFVPDAGTSRNAIETRRDHPTFFKGNLLAFKLPPETEKEIAINRGCVFKVQTKDGVRWYQPLIVANTGTSYPSVADFKGGAWQAKWDQVTGLTQLFYPGARPAELPPCEWSIDYDSLDQGRDDECLPRSTSPRKSSGSCARLRSCWVRAARPPRPAGGSPSASRLTIGGARNMAA